jgi:hypothetical protein
MSLIAEEMSGGMNFCMLRQHLTELQERRRLVSRPMRRCCGPMSLWLRSRCCRRDWPEQPTFYTRPAFHRGPLNSAAVVT